MHALPCNLGILWMVHKFICYLCIHAFCLQIVTKKKQPLYGSDDVLSFLLLGVLGIHCSKVLKYP